MNRYYGLGRWRYLHGEQRRRLDDLPIDPEGHAHEPHPVQEVSQRHGPNGAEVQAPHAMQEQKGNEVLVILPAHALPNPTE